MCGPRFRGVQGPTTLLRCSFNVESRLTAPSPVFDRVSTSSEAGIDSPLFRRRFSVPITLRQKRETVFHETITLSFCNSSLMVSNEAPFCRNAAMSSLYFINARNSFGVRSNSCAASRNDCRWGCSASIKSICFWPDVGRDLSQRCPNVVQHLSGRFLADA